MHKLFVAVFFISIFLGSVFFGQNVGAVDDLVVDGGVISQVQTKSLIGGTAYEELVEVYNNSDVDLDVTNWCLNYGGINNSITPKSLGCLKPDNYNPGLHIFLPKRSSVIFVTQPFIDKNPKFGFDKIISSGMADDDRWVSLSDDGRIIDLVEWGTSLVSKTAEGGRASKLPPSGQLIQRKMITPDVLKDSNNNFEDFEPALARSLYTWGALYDVQDACLNIIGIQKTPPANSLVDAKANCVAPPVVDICKDIEDIQTDTLKYKPDAGGRCIPPPVDLCVDVDGTQETVPSGYKLVGGKCMLDLLLLKITELLPDAIGSDSGGEYVEIYNPNDTKINLFAYRLSVGVDDPKIYAFPKDSSIEPNSYMAFYNNSISFTLVNTASAVSIVSADDQLIEKVPIYTSPKEGDAWASIGDIWQYTNQATPGKPNLPSLVEVVEVKVETPIAADTTLRPCKDGQYRSEETNRCRNIIADLVELMPCAEGQERNLVTNRCRNIVVTPAASELSPCAEGQERNPATNRCRNIASAVSDLAPCAEGQERNPDTNRCRAVTSVLGESTLKPCDPGQERNPETNRCRDIVSSDIPKADYAPEQTGATQTDYTSWFILGGIGLIAVGYGGWEWRFELSKLFKNALAFLRRKK